jgi:hypothetical protein
VRSGDRILPYGVKGGVELVVAEGASILITSCLFVVVDLKKKKKRMKRKSGLLIRLNAKQRHPIPFGPSKCFGAFVHRNWHRRAIQPVTI